MKGPWEVYEEVENSRKKHKDLTFPTTRMLIWHNHRTTTPCHDLYPIIEVVLDDWKRLWDLSNNKYQLWDDKTSPITPHDAAQGYTLGNCYLIASLAAMAERPELIKNIFPTSDGKLSQNGIY